MLAVIFSDFYRQQSFGFQALRTKMHQISLILMSSMSVGTLVISGTQHTKSSQNGRNPRLASLGQGGRPPTVPFHHATHRRWSSARHQAKIKCSTQVQSIKTERHEPSPFGSTISDKLLDQDPNRLEQQHKTPDQCDTTTEGRDVPEPGRPA